MLRRTGFRRFERVKPAPAPLRPVERSGTYAANDGPLVQVVKHDYIRSDALMKAYRLIPCQHCGRSDGTVCGAHSNWAIHGKGGAIKGDDNRCASLCAACHVPLLDQGSKLSRIQRQMMWWTAHVRTVRELLCRELWPTKVPIPDTSTCPWEAQS